MMKHLFVTPQSLYCERQVGHLERSGMGPTSALSRAIREMEADGSIELPNLRRGRELVIASDYTSDNRSGDFKLLAFLVIGAYDLPSICTSVRSIRDEVPNLGNSVPEYKKDFRHEPRLEATQRWLNVIDKIPGIVLSMAIPLTQLNIFSHANAFDMNHPDLAQWKDWHRDTLVKALTAAHVIGMLVGGIAAFHQKVTWISDSDAITDDVNREGKLVNLFRDVMRLYSPRRPDVFVQTFTDRTYANSDIAKWLISVPDLVTGVLAKVFPRMIEGKAALDARVDAGVPVELTRKDVLLQNWLCDYGQPLRRLVVATTRGNPPNNFRDVWLTWRPYDGGDAEANAILTSPLEE